MLSRPKLAFCSAAVVLGVAGQAEASTSKFEFTASGTPVDTLIFELPTSPTPGFSAPNTPSPYFGFSGFAISVNSMVQTGTIYFNLSGGFSTLGFNPNINTNGPLLFSGPVTDPTFLDGTYTLTARPGSGSPSGTLVISSGIAVPEPATVVLLGAGLLGLGLARRNRG